jgi:hypothetical protein
MSRLRRVLGTRSHTEHRRAADLIARLPPYQVALWPDGWELHPDGGVTVRDTHAMAEARRWYRLAERNRAHDDGGRVMKLHGIFVPRSVVDMASRRFPSEQVASVALQLVAGDWIRERRRQLLSAPEVALRARALAWCGSRHGEDLNPGRLADLLQGLLLDCAAERLIPAADYGVEVRPDDAYGIAGWRCRVEVRLDPYSRARVAESLRTALVPWNRAVVRDEAAVPLIGVSVAAPRSAP